MARQPFDCTTCDKYHPHKEDQPARGGMCRARPPVPWIMVVGAQVTTHPLTHQKQQEPLVQQGAHYPGVGKGDYCFEHPAAKHSVIPLFGQGGNNNKPSGPMTRITPPEPTLEEVPAIMDEPKGKA